GTTTVTYTAEDAAGHTVTCSFDVTVTDDEDPTISGCPSDITVNLNQLMCQAVVSWTPPTAADNCPSATLNSSHNPGDTFGNGPTLVTYTATDAVGNTTLCTFTVTVVPLPDIDDDGDVDFNDLLLFVDVLLGLDTTPLHVARSDVNCDGLADGDDVQGFLDALYP
ncbi:MAG: HYR domain-containing protein, partial [Phycisphaerae bacterium]|nr:HYR domain-containing protein [Phycisphaerae bacterium]